ncbi:tetratricopeptide repeat protein [Algoriphagus sp. CAU 1675]|uniref:tetratricopeptide repeat protein n=1 Tax=Algoriphagus sp. CAU 1675 TaxID=3032597 RepID=UPI0023DBCF78|nr:tetratricopeptide repeat protein [Algoriphagus sp. CAU 1675]MDF2157852.1 tetratricopeptide repeat protein [Algoriphagus sp. CAU 1675]
MPNLERLTLLREFLKEEPNNPFNWYTLALELREKDLEEAARIFRKLLLDFPDYLPSYYAAAHHFTEMDEIAEAKSTFEKGINLAKAQKEDKTMKELKNAFQNFLFEQDLEE